MARPIKLGLTRDQLASFLNDFEQIKQFEKLFATVDTISNVTLDDINIAAGNADASANEANDSIQRLIDALDRQASDQSAELLAAINALRQDLQLLPRSELGTMAPLQQADVPWLTFNNAPSPVPVAVGSMYWDGGTTLGIQATANVLIRVGESQYVYVKASSAITKGQLCYHTGSVGSSGVITAAPTPLALADPNQIIGVAAESIPLNGFGLIQIGGDLRGFNTTGSSVGETWVDGDPLYYNPAYVGSMTKSKPSAPNQKTYIGEVINAGSGSSGSISIRITPGSILGGTDSNVQFSGIANGDLIQYDSALQYWKNVAPSAIVSGTATNIAGGAANRILYQTGASTTGFIVAPTIANTYLEWSGSAFQWSTNPLGTVTSVSGTGTVNGLTLTGTVTTSGSLTLGGTLSNIANSSLTNSSITINGSAISLGGSVSVGTVTSVSGTGTVNGITLTGSVTSSGSLTLGGTLSGIGNSQLTNSSITINGSAISLGGSVSVGTVTTASVASANGFAGTVANASTTPAITISTTVTGMVKGNGTSISAATKDVDYVAPAAPLTKTADFTVGAGENWFINNKSGSTCTVTLPTASSFAGRAITFQNYQDQLLVSASSNVIPRAGGSAGTAILDNVAGNWATLVSDGTNWVIMQAAPFNCMLI